MCHSKISEMPDQIGGAEGLCGSLHGTREIKDDPNQEKWQRIATRHIVPRTSEGHDKIGGARYHRYHHSHATQINAVCSHQGMELKTKW